MAVDFLGALGAGADIDSKSLVQSLVDAERFPKEQLINSKIEKSEATISAYGIVAASLESLQVAFEKLNDAKDFAEYSLDVAGNETASGSPAFTMTATADAAPGSTSVSVTNLAKADRFLSDSGYAAADTELNGGATFTVSVALNGDAPTTFAVVDTTPSGVVDAINDADLGISARLVDTGDASNRYKIVVTGEIGAENSFTISTNASSGETVSFGTQLSTAEDATIAVDGVTITRPTNTISDVIDGITLSLIGESVGTGTITVSQSYEAIKSRILDLADVYNAIHEQFSILRDADSAADLGGTLSSDSIFSNIERQVQSMISNPSTTPGSSLSYLSDIGVSFTRSGTLEVDENVLNTALSENMTDVITMLSADTDNQSTTGVASRGIAGDALKSLADMLSNDGPVRSRTSNLETRVADYQEDLEDLDRRMSQIYDRYLAQFTVMEQMVDRMNSTREFLESTLDALPFTNKQ